MPDIDDCYLDEVVEARQDTTVVIHPLADHRRSLSIERQGGVTLAAAPGFCLVVCYNPGYQSVLKDLKVSTRQRMVSIELGLPTPEVELEVLIHETGIDRRRGQDLVRLAAAFRQHRGGGLREAASTRSILAAATQVRHGVEMREARISAVSGPLTDDPALAEGLLAMIESYAST